MFSPLAISRLLSAGHDLHLPLDGEPPIIITIDGKLSLCDMKNASCDADRSPIIRSDRVNMKCSLIVVSDQLTKTVWLLPTELFASMTMLRLGKKYEEYTIPEPASKDYKQQRDARKTMLNELPAAARAAVEKLMEGK